MATVNPRSPGSQVTGKGVVQGVALTSPMDGLPVNVIIDANGIHRLAVNADISVDEVIVNTRDLAITTDAVGIGDKVNGYYLAINSDGSINANVTTSAFTSTPDSILIAGTQNGEPGGTSQLLKVNSDGSLNVNVQNGMLGTVLSYFSQVLSVATGATQTLQTYTVPNGHTDYLLLIEVSGTNIATYDVLINNIQFARKRTYFGGNLDITFNIGDSTSNGYKLNAADILTITVTNFRPDSGDFESRIQLIEV